MIEVFSYTGKIPQDPESIIRSGRMFEPEHIGHSVFEKGRWQIIFNNPHYDMWKDSDYENISFLSPVGHMWKGKKEIKITEEIRIELKEAGIPNWIMHFGVDLEVKIRSVIESQGIKLNYEQVVEQRKSEYPQPRDLDKKLKEMIAPFRWLSGKGKYTVSLDAGVLNCDCFARHHMSGSGYDWEKVASAFIEKHGIDAGKKLSFDCEADIFSVNSSSKKLLKEFSTSFHKLVMDTNAFEEFLSQL